jgi:phosphoglycerol transferase MdoB-like AlkP superfamily enzyme
MKRIKEKFPISFQFIFLVFFSSLLFLILKLNLTFFSHSTHVAPLIDYIKAFLFGLRFDFSSVGILVFLLVFAFRMALFLNSRAILWVVYLATALWTFFIVAYGVGDIMYFLDSGRHLSYEFRNLMDDPTPLLLSAFKNYTAICIIGLTLILASQYFLFQFYFQNYLRQKNQIPTKINWLEILVCLILSASMNRGGFSGYIIEPSHIYQVGNDKLAQLIANPSFIFLHQLLNQFEGESARPVPIELLAENPSLELKTFFNPSNAKLQRSNKKTILNNNSGSKFPKNGQDNNSIFFKRHENEKPNVILILLESWSEIETKKPGVSPFFNSIRAKGLTSKLMMTSAKRTTEGIFNTFCSFPNPLGNSIARNQLMNFQYYCLPKILKENGWSTAMFQGTSKETAGTGSVAQLLGIEKSYGIDEIESITQGRHSWGAYDQDIYASVLNKIPQMQEPYFITINTNSTHDFQLPKNINFEFGDQDNQAKFTSVLHFADLALEEYFHKLEVASKRPTLFIFVGDHTKGIYPNNIDQFSVPFAIYFKDSIQPHNINAVTHQRDIAPTLLDYLKIPIPQNFTGHSLLSEQNYFYGDYFTGQSLGWVQFPNRIEIDLFNKNKISCYDINSSEEAPCLEKHKALRAHALAYTWLTQKLLFAGKTLEFGNYLK